MPPLAVALWIVAAVGTMSPATNEPVTDGPEELVAADTPDPPAESGHAPDEPLRVHTSRVEPGAVERGLELRVGPRWRAWTIDIDDSATADAVEVRLSSPSGQVHTRTLTLMGATLDARSRELASALALLIEQLPDASTPTPPPASSTTNPAPTPSASGWLGVGPRAALNARPAVDPDVGVSLAGGAWLMRAHLQPVAELAWSGWSRRDLRLDAIRFGLGLLGGAAPQRGRLWLGGGVLARAQWARAAAGAVARGWWASPAVVAALQYRGRILVAGAWVGTDLSLPPLVARDGQTTLRWSLIRPMATIHVGIRLPPSTARRAR